MIIYIYINTIYIRSPERAPRDPTFGKSGRGGTPRIYAHPRIYIYIYIYTHILL